MLLALEADEEGGDVHNLLANPEGRMARPIGEQKIRGENTLKETSEAIRVTAGPIQKQTSNVVTWIREGQNPSKRVIHSCVILSAGHQPIGTFNQPNQNPLTECGVGG